MGKGFKKGAGGANPLNFKVVGGTTVPANPKENMIWVNTDRKITGYYFTSLQPENMAEGEVWFAIGITSRVEFNALKENGIQVYPISVKQYVGGAWVDVAVKIYQNGTWSVLITDTYLYNNGDFCEDVTGGWKSLSIVDGSNKAGTLGKTDNGQSITIWAAYAGAYSSTAGYVVQNAIDVTHFEDLTINITGVDGAYGCSFFLCLFTPGMTDWNTGTIAEKQFTATGKTTLDISSITGEVGIGIKVINNYSNQLIKMTYNSVCLIP